MNRSVGSVSAVAALGVCLFTATAAAGQNVAKDAGLYAPSIWDVKLGAHARELPVDEFIDFACGTNGGPPAQPLTDWSEFGKCQPQPGTGYREVYFRYDDEPEYWARARSLPTQVALYEYTSVFAIPIIASALFDDAGFVIGLRMVTDPRVPTDIRENGVTLAGYLMGQYGEDGWACEDLPRLPGEADFHASYIKRRCAKDDVGAGLKLAVEVHNFRRAGQGAIDAVTRLPTEGQFESSTRFELVSAAPVPQEAERIAQLPPRGVSEKEQLVARARNCPGCDLRGVNLKRADLTGANLAGADLSGANLHGARLSGANLAGANLAGANVNRADLKRANLSGAQIQGAMLYESRFDGADLTGADLTRADAGKVQFIGAKLRGAVLKAVDLRDSRLNDADFAGANLSDSWFHDARMDRVDLSNAKLQDAVMWRVVLTGANLAGADLQGADLFGANLRGADLSRADLSYARLTSANLADTTTDGALWVDADVPAGFVPN